ncbi:MAG: hypothetical protein KDJ87_02055 [Rhizobiaceae bacterium]|nr:hypothetical protein [Rhizobiaceae bacterium]
MARGSVLPSVLFFAASAASASAAIECRQENAIYGDRDGAYELRFEAVDSEAANSSYQLRVSVKNTGIELTGFVMETEPVNRPSGILFHDCPDGDTTGEEIARCTVWQGVIYSANEGRIDLLPVAGAPAARDILLPGLALSLLDSTAWGDGKATVVPWDVLSLKGCRT